MAKRRSPISVVEQAAQLKNISDYYSFLYDDGKLNPDAEEGLMEPKKTDSVAEGRKISAKYNYDDLPEDFKVADRILNSVYMKAMDSIDVDSLREKV
jgi:hypothetical protein